MLILTGPLKYLSSVYRTACIFSLPAEILKQMAALFCCRYYFSRGDGNMKVEINREGCIGCGLCAATCPEVFRMADDGLAEVYAEPTETNSGLAKEAAAGCPVQVIAADE